MREEEMVKPSELERDRFYKRAKERGYRSRSAFKLIALQKRFHLMQRGDIVVDLGAAPGGWSQVASRIVGEEGRVVSVDIKPFRLSGVIFVRSDIRDVAGTVRAIRDALGKTLVDVVLSDVSPNLSGNRSYDQYLSFELSSCALRIAHELLRNGGNFVTKIFQGAEFKQFYDIARENFSMVKAFTPEATRKRSSEVYIVGKKFHR
ncbi:MAG: RlmE family RNA methyltransferase [Canidatus Methanoxibalbensis ujae]|nr:RlmE family RNA methyltransferase [Candidatus Methanoxibalbensis ujae]MCW7078097.1 RlmE family RNA methyltransferase [Candidatus Methanoxibalbensis ujae]